MIYKTLKKVSDERFVKSYKNCLTCTTKNLFNPLGREDANPTGNFPITKYDVGNVIYRGIAYSGYYQFEGPDRCDVTVSGAVITVVEKVANYGVGYIVKCNPNTVYTLSFQTNFNVIVSIFLDLEGNKLGDENWSRTFTTSNNTHYLLVVLASTTIGTYFIKNLQLELGDTATDYVPYGIIPSYKKSLVCKTKNLFDISKLQAYTPETLPTNTAGVYNGTIIARAGTNNAVCESGKTLKELCPDLVAGERYTLSFKTIAKAYTIYLRGANEYWRNNNSYVVTEAMLNSIVCFYANYPELTVATTSNFQLELGDTVTEYHPYGYL